MDFEISLAEGRALGDLPITYTDFQDEQPPFDPFATPYESFLCFDVLFKKVEEVAERGDAGAQLLAREILRELDGLPELRGPMKDSHLIHQHRRIFELLLTFLFPPLIRERELYKISLPFRMEAIYHSEAMGKLMSQKDVCYNFGSRAKEVWTTQIVHVGTKILKSCYGVEVDMVPTAMLTVPDKETGLARYYRPYLSSEFIEVVPQGELPPLSREDIQRLTHNINDAELWLKLLPPEKFYFHGFHIGHMLEVTEEESLSRLKQRMISRDAVLDIDRIKELAALMRTHFKQPELSLGLAAVDYPVERAVDHEYRIRYNLLADFTRHLTSEEYRGSIYDRAFRSRNTVLIDDLTKLPERTKLEDELIRLGYRSIVVAPLLDQESNVIGIVEVAAPRPSGIDAFQELKFNEIRALFRTAVERSREYIDNRIEAIMRDQFTSLHPSVEWRFTEAAFNILEQQDAGHQTRAEEISFKQVYPFYGQADIVGSSTLRNAAIYQDLIDNLRAGRFFLVRALDLISFPLVNQVLMTLDTYLAVPSESFDNGQELKFGTFIHEQLTPLIEQLGEANDQLRPLARDYQKQLDPELNVFYRLRRDYEQSVAGLNRMLSDFFSERDQASQATLPHYFEKYKTDGVEYEIYAGQSLLRSQKFSNIHLRNLRLSQLVDMCTVTRGVQALSETLPMPLVTAQLIFAYTTPLDIRFRMDEKRFDVDGDYNVRYEILKKRIDKATVHNGRERLTLPGRVSIVYLQDRDREEYDSYLHYLHQAGYVEGEPEYLELDPLQGVSGLRALRFRVRM